MRENGNIYRHGWMVGAFLVSMRAIQCDKRAPVQHVATKVY